MRITFYGLALASFSFLSSLSAQAVTTQINLQNNTGQLLCVAVTHDSATTQGRGVLSEGWNCFPTGTILRLKPFDGVIRVAVRKESGADYVSTYRLSYDIVKTWVRKDLDMFGLEVINLYTGGYGYSYLRGPDDWSDYVYVAGTEGLNTMLDGLGFLQFDAWVFRTADLSGGLGLALN